jgi:hypothetical protein
MLPFSRWPGDEASLGHSGVALQADIEQFYSSGINISPLKSLAPENV